MSRPTKIANQQSDIIIGPNGEVHVSFLWRDLFSEPSPNHRRLPAWQRPHIAESDPPEYQACKMCPKQCRFNRKARSHPSCGDDRLRVSNVGISMGDEELIRGRNGSGCIMLSGCPLRCPSCHNPEKVADGEIVTGDDFLKLCENLLADGAENIQILSPTVHGPRLRNALRALRDSNFPLPVVLKSSGYESVEEIERYEGLVDVWLPDLKFGPCSKRGRKSGAADYFEVAQQAIGTMLGQVGPAQIEDGLIKRGVLVRQVKTQLPNDEQEGLTRFLRSLPAEVIVDSTTSWIDFD